jgi:hypothetical protein
MSRRTFLVSGYIGIHYANCQFNLDEFATSFTAKNGSDVDALAEASIAHLAPLVQVEGQANLRPRILASRFVRAKKEAHLVRLFSFR